MIAVVKNGNYIVELVKHVRSVLIHWYLKGNTCCLLFTIVY